MRVSAPAHSPVRSVLVTGVSRHLGSQFARVVSHLEGVERVIGVDTIPPPEDLSPAQFSRVDIRHPLIARVIQQAHIDTVVHMGVISTPTTAGGRVSMKEINVIGSMQLLAACQKSPQVRRLVVKSTAGVYGSSATDPAMFTEDIEPSVPPRSGWSKDTAEVEGYVRALSRRRPDLDVTLLRFANIVGPGMRTALTDIFELPLVPVVAGFDPALQVVHEDDAVAALAAAVSIGQAGGVINVAGDGVLSLLQMLAMAGHPPVFVPAALTGPAARVVKAVTGVRISDAEWSLLRYGRGLDTTRMRQVLGFTPAHTAQAAFEDYLRARDVQGWHRAETVEQGQELLERAVRAIGVSLRGHDGARRMAERAG